MNRSPVHENDIYLSGSGIQATLHNTAAAGHCHRLISSRRRWEGWGAVSGTMVIGVVGSGRRYTVDQLLARNLPNNHGARCVINPTESKAWFPALSDV